MNYRENAKQFARAFIQGQSEDILKEIAMTIPRVEWSLCFENWENDYDVPEGIFQTGVSSKEFMKIIAEVGYNLASNKPVKSKVLVDSGVPKLYTRASDHVHSSCQEELVEIHKFLI